jgi:hypothetical protein
MRSVAVPFRLIRVAMPWARADPGGAVDRAWPASGWRYLSVLTTAYEAVQSGAMTAQICEACRTPR